VTPAAAADGTRPSLYTTRIATWAGILLVCAAATLYIVTLDRWLTWGDLAGGDLITHQYAQVQARPSNAPGYPLYTMGGWLWFHGLRSAFAAAGLPYPNPIPILSGYSTLWALIALWLLYRTLTFLTSSRYAPDSLWGEGGNWPLAWLVGAFYTVTYFFWYYATTTEQYSSAVAQTLAIVYVYLLWARADRLQESDYYAGNTRAGRLLVLLAFLCGISLAHMLTVAFIVPPLVAVVLWQRPSLMRNGRLVAAVVAAALLPLAAYLYVYIRGMQHPEWWGGGNWQSTAQWFWAFVSTSQGREELGWGFEAGRTFFGNGFPQIIWQELSAPLLLAGLIGIVWLKQRTALMLYSTLVIYLLFNWAYRYGNWFQVILPAYPLLLLGLAGVALRLARLPGGIRQRWLQVALLLLLVSAVGWRFAASWPQADSSRLPADEALTRAAVLLDAELPPEAALFAERGEATALDYMAQIWALRPDLRIVGSSQAQAALMEGDPLLATWSSAETLLAEIEGVNSVQAHNSDWVLMNGPTPAATPSSDSTPLNLPTLEQYTTQPSPSGAPVTAPYGSVPPALDVRLRWRLPEGGWPNDLALSLRPTLAGNFIPDPTGAPGAILQVDAAAPLHGLAALAPGGVTSPLFEDAYRLPLAAPLPNGADGIALILYRTVADGAGGSGFETVADLRLPLKP
jgi:hypothetical protein